MRTNQSSRIWLNAGLLLGILGCLALAALIVVVAINLYRFRVTTAQLRILFVWLLLAVVLISAGAVSYYRYETRRRDEIRLQYEARLHDAALDIRCYWDNFGERDYEVIRKVIATTLPHRTSNVVNLYPLQGGFSGAKVFQVNIHGFRPLILKLGSEDKVRSEADKYVKYVKDQIPAVELKGQAYEEPQGALLFGFATMEGNSITFEQFLLDRERSNAEVATIARRLYTNTLGAWHAGRAGVRQRLCEANYILTDRDWERIASAIRELGFDPKANRFEEVDLLNPFNSAQKLFEERRGQVFEIQQSIVHGDLNARNILIDANQNVFVIDFAKTSRDCLLRDYCKLEIEIKFCLTKLLGPEDLLRAIEIEKQLLLDNNSQKFPTLRGLLEANVPQRNQLERMLQTVRTIRTVALDMMGPLASAGPGSSEPYYIILLHYTLDALRYQQTDRWSKLFVLNSAAMICRALQSENSQHHEHS